MAAPFRNVVWRLITVEQNFQEGDENVYGYSVGVFSIVRHSQSLGGAVLHMGMCILLSAWYALLFTPGCKKRGKRIVKNLWCSIWGIREKGFDVCSKIWKTG